MSTGARYVGTMNTDTNTTRLPFDTNRLNRLILAQTSASSVTAALYSKLEELKRDHDKISNSIAIAENAGNIRRPGAAPAQSYRMLAMLEEQITATRAAQAEHHAATSTLTQLTAACEKWARQHTWRGNTGIGDLPRVVGTDNTPTAADAGIGANARMPLTHPAPPPSHADVFGGRR